MKTVAVIAGLTTAANAHATWQYLWKNEEDLGGSCVRKVASNSPVEDYTGTALQCNVNPAKAEGNCEFKAGDTVTIEMHQHDTRSSTEEGIGGVHWGPVLAYMAAVDDAATATGAEPFFKVYQNTWAKAPGSTQGDKDFWGTKDMNFNGGKLDFKIPANLAPGDYLLRAEAIALHAASESGGAQHYPGCFQLTVTGGGSLVPTETVTFPEAYNKTGPGLGFKIYAPLDSYPAPGPALIEGGTEATPQLSTFGTIQDSPQATSAPRSSATEPTSSAASATSATTSAPASSAPAAQMAVLATRTADAASTSSAPAPSASSTSSRRTGSTRPGGRRLGGAHFVSPEEADAADEGSSASQESRRHARAFRG